MDFGVVFPTTAIGTDPAVTMQSGTGYQRIMHHKLGRPTAHIAALGEFARAMRGG